MFQKAAVFLSWQAELLPGFSLKQAIVRVPMNHPEHTQKHKGVVSCELRGARKKPGEFQGLALQVVRSKMAAYRGLVYAEGCTSEADQLHGACTEDFSSNPHHSPACCSIPLCSQWRKWGGWLAESTQLPHASSSLSLYSHC